MLHVFIDTNILLRFYSYSDDALAEVEKLSALAVSGQIRVMSTQQVVEEWARNRDKELESSLKRMDSLGSESQIPRFAAHLTEASVVVELLRNLKAAKSDLKKAISAEVDGDGLRADKVIEGLLFSSPPGKRNSSDIAAARLRSELGNPPGKQSSLGDQINWEMMLSLVPLNTDLHVISRDGDFKNAAFSGQPNFFLEREWRVRKSAKLFIYDGLAAFTKIHFPNIKVPVDAVRTAAISRLVESGSFVQTHAAVAELLPLVSELTDEEGLTVLVALATNKQISDIISDVSVTKFYKEVWSRFLFETTSELDKRLEEVSSDIFGIPF